MNCRRRCAIEAALRSKLTSLSESQPARFVLARPEQNHRQSAISHFVDRDQRRCERKTELWTNPSEASEDAHINANRLIRDNREWLRFRADTFGHTVFHIENISAGR